MTWSPFDTIQVGCCSGLTDAECVCGPAERVLRAYVAGRYQVPMTAEQRRWCLKEADRAGEGSFPTRQAEQLSDPELARWVLRAWWSYLVSNCL